MKLNLAPRIVLYFTCMAAVLIGTVGAFSYYQGSESLKAAVSAEILATAIEKEAALNRWLEDRLEDLERFAGQPEVIESVSRLATAAPESDEARSALAVLRQALERIVDEPNDPIIGASIIDAAGGKVLVSNSPTEVGASKLGRTYFENGKTAGYLQPPYQSADLHEEAITAAAPLRTSDGRTTAVIATRLHLTDLATLVQIRSGLHRSSESYLISSGQVAITAPLFEPGLVGRRIETGPAHACAAGGGGIYYGSDYRGIPVISTCRWNLKGNLGLIVKLDQAEAFAPIHEFARVVTYAVGFLLLAAAGIAVLLARSITRPLLALNGKVREFGKTNREEPLDSSGDEVAMLDLEFKRMSDRVAKRSAELAEMVSEARLSEERFRTIFDSVNDAIIVHEIGALAIVDANRRANELYGYTADEFRQFGLGIIFSDKSQSAQDEAIRLIRLAASGAPQVFEWPVLTKEGNTIWVEVSLRRTTLGGRDLLLSVARDISERKDAELLLKLERDFTTALIDGLPGVFCVLDEKGSLVRWNHNLSGVIGLSDQELLGHDALALVVETDRKMVGRELIDAFQTGHAEIEFGVAAKSGEVRQYHWTAQLVTRYGHLNLIGVGIDVTEAREADKRLQASENKFHTVFDVVHDGIIIHDATTGSFLDVNQRLCDMFGYSRDEMLKLDVGALGTGSGAYTRDKAESHFKMAMANKSANFEWQCKKKDGSHFWADVFIRCADIDNKPFVISTAHDITERTQLLEDLRYRDQILHAVTIATSQLIAGESFGVGAQKAIEIIGEAMKVDRVSVLKHADEGCEPPLTSYCWRAPGSGLPPLGALPPVWSAATHEAVKAWLAPMIQGKPVIAHARTADAPIRELLESLQNKSVLLMPILSGGKPWGVIGIDSCKSERDWTGVDIEALEIFAEIVGIVIFRNGTADSLKKSEERFRAVSETAQDAIIMINPLGRVTYWNRGAVNLLGYNADEAIGRPVHEWLTPTRFREKAMAGMGEFAATGRGNVLGKTMELAANRKDGTEIPIELTVSSMRFGAEWHAVAFMRDISERKRAMDQITHLARHDSLTGLPNRAVFVEELRRAVASAHRAGKTSAVFYLDLDHFKDVNDTLGHPVGDLLLQEVARRLRAAIRETDVVARFGGDEFALLASEIGEPADAATVADKVLKTLAAPFSIQGNTVRSGASVGIAVYGLDSPDAEGLLSHADVALYRAKSEGRGTYRFFTDAMDHDVRTRVTLAAELRNALESGQLFLMYQPQVNIDTDRIIGVEALVRWQHPTRGLVSPGEFIPAAEKNGLIVEIGRWVLHEACRQMKKWLDAGIAPPLIAVNVSGLQFKTPLELENDIRATLAETGLSPQSLELEFTETVFMEASREHNDLLIRLRTVGLRLAIDDFGTGYSSLAYLGRFPVDRVKIAQNFISNLVTGSANATIVKAAIGLAHDLGLDVIVEGVETSEQLELIRSFGGHKVQGFYYSKPLPLDGATAFLRKGKIPSAKPVAIAAAE
jgi:diguanylate cyclase (GGDEF)-like protein/PAS domain S-box-containing protein